MSGFPNRPDRDSFGPEVVNRAPVRDNRREWDASIANLIMHQSAGLGLVSPRTALVFSAGPGPEPLMRAEAWNPHRLTGAPYTDPEIVRTGLGDYMITYPTPIPDEAGADQAVSFSWALAFASVDTNPAAFCHAQASVDAQTNRIRVCVYDASLGLADGFTIVVLGW